MRFASADEAMLALFAQFGPADDSDWRFTSRLSAEPVNPTRPDIRTAHGAIARTMHFGLVRVDLATGDVTFVDEDHRDGGDDERMRAKLPADWIAALRALDWPRP